MLMIVKNILRYFGFDIRRYYPLWETDILPRNILVVLDIGANDGEFSAEALKHLPKGHVYAFEPLADCFARIEKRFEGNSHFHAFNTALGEMSGKTQIRRSSFHPSSSLLPMAALHKDLYPKTAGETLETITIEKLDTYLPKLNLTGNLLIKMDVQGFEDKVIAGGTETFKKASLVLVETSFKELYEGQPLFGDIHDKLRALGFSYHGATAQHRSTKDKTLLYQDSLFIKTEVGN